MRRVHCERRRRVSAGRRRVARYRGCAQGRRVLVVWRSHAAISRWRDQVDASTRRSLRRRSMKPDDPDLESGGTAAGAEQHHIAFLPFLRLKRGYTIAGVEFLPLRDPDGKVPPPLESAVKAVETILSGYV